MAEAQKGSEQSMDDILASIRRIISDDPLAATSPSGTEDAAQEEAPFGRQVIGDGDIGLPGKPSIGAASLRNPTDDLSDILEPSKVPSSHRGIAGLSGGASATDGGMKEPAATSWAFDGSGGNADFGGSLKDKLASLDGRGQPGGLPGTEAPASVGNDDAPVRTDGAPRKTKPDLDAATAVGDAADPGKIVPERQSEATAAAATARSVAGAVKLSEEDVASIPSVQAAVEQTAVDTQEVASRDVAQVAVAKAQSSEADQSDTRVAEVSEGAEQTAGDGAASGAAASMAATPVGPVSRDGATAAAVATTAPEAVGLSEPGGKTVEALVTEALEPKLQQWLDANLPRLVEEKLQAEIERLSRDGKLKIS